MNREVRWMQRFDNYRKAFYSLRSAAKLAQKRSLSKLEKQGVIQGFEYTHELAWNTLKDYLTEKGIIGLIGSRDSTREAFAAGLISNGESWMDMIKARNLTSHTYDEDTAEKVYRSIVDRFFPAFESFIEEFQERLAEESDGN